MTAGAERLVTPAPPVALDPLLAWLVSPRAVAPGGVVKAWWNTAGTGYPYPEAGGLWLSLFCGEPALRGAAPEGVVDEVAAWLCRGVEQDGAATRHGRSYVFDSGVVLTALVAYARSGGRHDVTAATAKLARFVLDGVDAGRSVFPANSEPPSHWSNVFGPHLLKTCFALHRFGEHAGSVPTAPIRAIVDQVLRFCDGERFVVADGSVLSYLHATIYGYEGLVWLDAHGYGSYRDVLGKGAAFVASLQQADGGIPPFWDGRTAWGAARSDVAAQAVRLWLLVDPVRFAAPIARALAFLGSLQVPEGGVRYSHESADVNTWASLFAAQALAWQRSGARVTALF